MKDFELILVNDGSKDSSGKICDEYATRDNRIRVIHSGNSGHGGARNLALDIAKGEYIGWVDADDRIDRDMFETLYVHAKKYGADITECNYIEHRKGKEVKNRPPEDLIYCDGDLILDEFFTARMTPHLWNKLYKSRVFEKTRFPVGRIHVDFYVNILLAIREHSYLRIPEAKYHYISRDSSITNSFTAQKMREAVMLYDYTRRLEDLHGQNPKARQYLKKDAINRLIWRSFDIASNPNSIENLRVYTALIRKRLGPDFAKFLLKRDLPLKTRVSYFLFIYNMISVQKVLHRFLGN